MYVRAEAAWPYSHYENQTKYIISVLLGRATRDWWGEMEDSMGLGW